MPSSEYEDWRLFHQEEPFGAPWENLMMAWPTAVYVAANTRKGKKAPGVSDFMYRGPEAQAKKKRADNQAFLMRLDSKAKR